jgi:hypothetical protein
MEFDLKHIDGSLAKASDAAALIKLMIEWFHAHYVRRRRRSGEDPEDNEAA